MKNIVIKVLAFFSRLIIKKYNPKIIGVTGSVGKTSAKEYIGEVLSLKYNVRSSIKNYNNEFGLPLSIIGLESPGKNMYGWLIVFWRAISLIALKKRDYPDVLVLEMGIDRSGDMDYLLSIVRPDIGVLTNISHSHIEYFGSLDKIKKEKIKMLKGLKDNGIAILNFDNKILRSSSSEIKKRVVFYGLKKGADFQARDVRFVLPENILKADFYGAVFKLESNGSVVPVNVPGVISYPAISAILAALSVGKLMNISLMEMIKSLNNNKPLSGRMRVIPGIKDSIIIDDTYNSSPESSLSALDSIKSISSPARKIAVFGDMLELGHYTEKGHQAVGERVSESDINILILVGERARDIGRGALKTGFKKDNIFNFSEKKEAIEFIKNKIEPRDIILVKASQGGRLEKLVEAIMKNPSEAKGLLVRQDEGWD
jgi:UDP-N-acetylmuramoyl-tripeptide--D-alanyl-D-alanine ligase